MAALSSVLKFVLSSVCFCNSSHTPSLSIQVGQGYPHEAPKVKCETMVYHPNIDLEGNVCLNILR